VRDGLLWSKYLNQVIDTFGASVEVVFAPHHWPTWENARIVAFLKKQRDLYKYIHDQSVRLLNLGYTGVEIAERLRLPPALANESSCRGYYGTLSHNAKAVYQRYMGWFDGNPANLHRLPPEESAGKYVELAGGVEALLTRAHEAFAAGEYRWVVELVNHAVFADPGNVAARALQANALEQLGYQAESGPWRNFYLTGAKELREGVPEGPASTASSGDVVSAMSVEAFFDYVALHINGSKAMGQTIVLNWDFTDLDQQYVMTLENSALTYTAGRQAAGAHATIALEREALNLVLAGSESVLAAIESGDITIEGNHLKLIQLMLLMDSFELFFNMVTP
jgi:alkyl sulfatase BDS1-like metallo-beta-lactamase superfamily hydrolase